MIEDFTAAVRSARTEEQRVRVEYDRAIMFGDWQNLASLVDRVVATSNCELPIWFDAAALPYGNVADSSVAIEREIACNPFDFRARLHQFRAAMWRGEFAESLEIAASAYEVTAHPLFQYGKVAALLALARGDDAELLIEREIVAPVMNVASRFWLAAYRTDTEEARALKTVYRERFGTNAADVLYFDVLLGDREAANATAAMIDARPFGHMLLASAIMTCFCGINFDLEATPNFARMIGQSGLSWPPESPMRWPLKDW